MRVCNFITIFLALALIPGLLPAQSFNHLYPAGNKQPGVSAKDNGEGFELLSRNDPQADTVFFINILTDTLGVLTGSDTVKLFGPSSTVNRFQKLSDGNYIESRIVFPFNTLLLTKYSANGDTIWSEEYFVANYANLASSRILEGPDGDLFIYGSYNILTSLEGMFYVIKANEEGEEIWTKTYSAVPNNTSFQPSTAAGTALSDGGFILVGATSQAKKFIFHLDANGNSSILNSVFTDITHLPLVIQSVNNKIGFAYTYYTGSSNFVARIEQYDLITGAMDWQLQIDPFTYPGFPQKTYITAVTNAKNGDYLLAGYGSTNIQPERFFMARVDTAGQLLWKQYDYGFTANPSFITGIDDGCILVAGLRDEHTWLLHTDSLGNVNCSPSVNNITAEICQDEAYNYEGQLLSDAGHYTFYYQPNTACDSLVNLYLLVNPHDTIETHDHLCLGEYSSLTGKQFLETGIFTEDSTYYNQYGCESSIINTVEVVSTIFIEGWAWVPYGTEFLGQIIYESGLYWSTDTSEFGCITIASFEVTVINTASAEQLAKEINLITAPNPFCNEVRISFELPAQTKISASVYNGLGQEISSPVQSQVLTAGEHILHIKTDDWPPGIYFLQLSLNNEITSKRMLKICQE